MRPSLADDAGTEDGGAAAVRGGILRMCADLDLAPLCELSLVNGRRVDVMALARDGRFWAIEIKSSRRDFLSDRKWREYLDFADWFSFAVPEGFPLEILPDDEGLVVADRFEAAILRPARHRPLPAPRRRSLSLRFARTAALRLQALAPLANADILQRS